MTDDDTFLRGVPKFLRRPEEPMPENPIFMTARDLGVPPPAHIPAAFQASAEAPARRPGSLLPPRPVQAVPEPAPGTSPEMPEVVSLPSRRATRIPSGDFFAEAREGIADLLATASPDLASRGPAPRDFAPRDSAPRDLADAEDDAAFQVTLPRSVIRQIRILAAQEGTTQRAIVLKALRLAGLAVPEGADIDRRILAGRRRQQA